MYFAMHHIPKKNCSLVLFNSSRGGGKRFHTGCDFQYTYTRNGSSFVSSVSITFLTVHNSHQQASSKQQASNKQPRDGPIFHTRHFHLCQRRVPTFTGFMGYRILPPRASRRASHRAFRRAFRRASLRASHRASRSASHRASRRALRRASSMEQGRSSYCSSRRKSFESVPMVTWSCFSRRASRCTTRRAFRRTNRRRTTKRPSRRHSVSARVLLRDTIQGRLSCCAHGHPKAVSRRAREGTPL